ncbi:MAG: glutamine cyclotransferase, partial [Bacteroidales bacterium]|nr:glutamine cyclotransferase [Bacteroidales bacterium]
MEFKIKNGGNVWALAAVFIALAVGCVACRTAEPAEAGASKGHAATPAAHFDRDSAYAFVARQVAFGPRTPGSVAHDRCADYLYAVLAGCADTVIRQPFTAERWDGRTMQGVNIIACFAPENPRRVLLAAHWDSRP